MFQPITSARAHIAALADGIPPHVAPRSTINRSAYDTHMSALAFSNKYQDALSAALIADLQTMALENNGIARDYFQTFAGEWIQITFIIGFDGCAVITLNGCHVEYNRALEWITSVI